MRFDQKPRFSLRLADFLGFFIPLNIFLLFFWIIAGQRISFLLALGRPLYFVAANALFFLLHLLRWSHIRGASTLFGSLKQGMREFTESVSGFINAILLFVVYLIGVGLTALVAKLFRKHFLDLRRSSSASYYLPKKPITTKDDYYRQF